MSAFAKDGFTALACATRKLPQNTDRSEQGPLVCPVIKLFERGFGSCGVYTRVESKTSRTRSNDLTAATVRSK